MLTPFLPPHHDMNRSAFSIDSSGSTTIQSDLRWLNQDPKPISNTVSSLSTAHCRFTPIHYEPSYQYPLVVWLHGAESNEEELWQVMPLISARNYVAIAPRGTQSCQASPLAYRWSQSVDDISEATDRVGNCIELAKEQFNVNPERIFLAGRGDGGTMAQRIGMENPELFAGAISFGGPVPQGARPLRSINKARELPLLLSVSPEEESYSLDHVMDDLRLLHSAGFQVALRLYPEGDGLTTTMLTDLDEWLMEGFCPSAVTSSS